MNKLTTDTKFFIWC